VVGQPSSRLFRATFVFNQNAAGPGDVEIHLVNAQAVQADGDAQTGLGWIVAAADPCHEKDQRAYEAKRRPEVEHVAFY
jgi:hypothetical protein